mmetsp:Transcript_17608/g.36728  ORF Transcript_17608/g.36728 Transcript_17608/m.36728 type:complete len:114 (+) Transcript_17608:419-760(+)
MHGVVTSPLGKLCPDDLQWFDVMCHFPPRSTGGDYFEHGRFVEDEAELVSGMCEHSQFGELDFKPAPGGLRPNNQVVVLIHQCKKLVLQNSFVEKRRTGKFRQKTCFSNSKPT